MKTMTKIMLATAALPGLGGCTDSRQVPEMGSYGYDVAFFERMDRRR